MESQTVVPVGSTSENNLHTAVPSGSSPVGTGRTVSLGALARVEKETETKHIFSLPGVGDGVTSEPWLDMCVCQDVVSSRRSLIPMDACMYHHLRCIETKEF